jgi:hypothetical protein
MVVANRINILPVLVTSGKAAVSSVSPVLTRWWHGAVIPHTITNTATTVHYSYKNPVSVRYLYETAKAVQKIKVLN